MSVQRGSNRDGFSLVEVVMALVILGFGLLALASAMGYMSEQVRAAELRSERTIAQQNVIERVRATEFDEIADRSETDAWDVGAYSFWWSVDGSWSDLRVVELYTKGPAVRAGDGVVPEVTDTTIFSVVREAT
ncbi:MAG: type IV pilus modification PilV family protein [Gemmatimonadota bacterium]